MVYTVLRVPTWRGAERCEQNINIMSLLLALLATTSSLTRPFELTLHLEPSRTAVLEDLFWAVSTPGTQEYLAFRSVAQLSALAGGSLSTVKAATSWLIGLGGTNVTVSSLRDRVTAAFDPAMSLEDSHWTARGLPSLERPSGVAIVTRRDFNGAAGFPRPLSALSRDDSADTYSISNQKRAYGIPEDLAAANDTTLQMVWGPGTFGYSPKELQAFASKECPRMNLAKIKYDTANHGQPGGDNFQEVRYGNSLPWR